MGFAEEERVAEGEGFAEGEFSLRTKKIADDEGCDSQCGKLSS